jgi:hypothetical protein
MENVDATPVFPFVREIGPQFYKIILPSGYVAIADLDLDDGQFHESGNEGSNLHSPFIKQKTINAK